MTIAKTFPARKLERLNFGASGDNYTVSGGVATIYPPCRGIIVGGAGTLNARLVDMPATKTTGALPAGTYPLQIVTVTQSGTTATELTLLW